jgi:hypothetical protein
MKPLLAPRDVELIFGRPFLYYVVRTKYAAIKSMFSRKIPA